MSRAFSEQQIKDQVNDWGSRESDKSLHYSFVGFYRTVIGGKTRVIVKIKNKSSGLVKENRLEDIKQGKNPFNYSNKLPDSELIKKINKVGLSYLKDMQFKVIKLEKLGGKRQVHIISLSSKEVKCTTVHAVLNQGVNPFRMITVKTEENVIHPIVKSFLIKKGLSVLYHEKKISKRSRPDFVFTTKNKKIIIVEVKSDQAKWSKKSLKTQTNKYKTDAKKMFGKDYAGTFLVSPNGEHEACYSLNDLSKVLKQKGMI